MLPRRGIHECGIAPDWALFHLVIVFLAAKAAEPSLCPTSIRIAEITAVERAVPATQS